KKTLSTAAASGSSGIQRSRLVVMSRPSSELPLQKLHVSGIESLSETKDRDDDRQAHHRLGGRHRHDEKHDHLPFDRAHKTREGDESQFDRIEHQLDRHQDYDDVAADDDPGDADGKENGAQHEIIFDWRLHQRCLCASATAPMIATSSSTEASPNGSAKSVNRLCAMLSGPPNEAGTAASAETAGRWTSAASCRQSAAAPSEPSIHHAAGRASIDSGFSSMMTNRMRIMIAPA